MASSAKSVFKCNYCPKTFVNNGKCKANHEESCPNRQPNQREIVFLPSARNIPSNDLLTGFNISVCHSSCELDKSGSPLDEAFSVHCSSSEKAKRSDLKSFEANVLSFFSNYKNKFSIAELNINSLRNKFDSLKFILNKQLVDVFVLNETKLDNKDDESLFKHHHYSTIRYDREELLNRRTNSQNERIVNRGWGVIVYIKNTIPFSNVVYGEFSEMISLRLKCHDKTIGLIACYRPPHNENEESFFYELERTFDSLESTCDEVLIAGDLNYDMLRCENPTKLDKFIDNHSLTNTIKSGTRPNYANGHIALLDVILCLNYLSFLASTVIPFP